MSTRATSPTSDGPDAVQGPWRDRRALLLLAPLGLAILALIAAEPWYSNFGVDSLTLFEQTRAVADHGSVGFDNGPVMQYRELRTRWFVGAHGRTWGIVPATFSYLFAPAMALGGFRGTVRAMWLVYALGALAVYALVYRVTRRPGLAVGAAYAAAFASPLPFWGTHIAPFMPAASLGVIAVYLASRAFDQTSRPRALAYAAGAGLLASSAFGCHLLWALPWAVTGGVFVLFGTLRERAERLALYLACSAPSLALMGWVNHQRFGTWNPISYGNCGTQTCEDTTSPQTAGAFAVVLKPVLPYVLAWALALWVARRARRSALLVAFFGPVAALVPDTPTRDRFVQLARAAWGYLVDLGHLNMGFQRGSEGVGNYVEGWVVRALLQCSPVIAAAFVAIEPPPAGTPARDRAARLMLAGVGLGVLFACTLRVEMGGPDIYGWPILNNRYMSLTSMAATALAFASMAHLPWRAWHAAVAAAAGVGFALYYGAQRGDEDLVRRQMIHWFPLALAATTLVTVAAARAARGWSQLASGHAAALCAALSVGYGGGVVFGIDRVFAEDYRGRQDARVTELARCAPEPRFILLGGYALDEPLALPDRRDIYFINVRMGPRDGRHARALVDQAMRPDRPAYLIQDDENGPWHFSWPGFTFRRPAGCARVWRIERTP